MKNIAKLFLSIFLILTSACGSKAKKPVVEKSQLSDEAKEYYDLILKYWKSPDSLEYFDENSHIPTPESAVKGVKYEFMDSGMYIYSVENDDEAKDILRCYILMILYCDEKNSLGSYQNYPQISVDGKPVCLLGSGKDDKAGGKFIAVGFYK